MAKFNVGDTVVCVDNAGIELCNDPPKVGEKYIVKYCGEKIEGSSYPAQVGITSPNGVWSADRFELYKEKIMKLKDIIRPFMRVRTRSEGIWIAVERDGETFLVQGNGFNHVLEAGEYGEEASSLAYDIMEVYGAPEYVCGYLDPDEYGKSVWTLPTPKSSQRLAQEAAVAELEASIKVSQDKLEQLKRSL